MMIHALKTYFLFFFYFSLLNKSTRSKNHLLLLRIYFYLFFYFFVIYSINNNLALFCSDFKLLTKALLVYVTTVDDLRNDAVQVFNTPASSVLKINQEGLITLLLLPNFLGSVHASRFILFIHH
jgi:hypothetical protein